MATTMNISLTDPLKHFIDKEVRDGGFAGTSDYMRDLIRKRQREKAEDALSSLVAEGLASGPAIPADAAWLERMRERARSRASK